MDSLILKKTDPTRAARIVVLCCDDPHHIFLLKRLSENFRLAGIVIESNAAQLAGLLQKKRYKLWLYRKYHARRRKWFGHSAHRRQFFRSNFSSNELNVPVFHADDINARAVAEFLRARQPDLTICAGTMYIGRRVRTAAGHLINLHTGILPDYKGNQCIFFALYEKQYDKIGLTLHLVTEHLDGGPIIDQVRIEVQAADDDESLYCRAFEQGVEKLLEILQQYEAGAAITARFQPGLQKKTYSHCDRTPWREALYWAERMRARASKRKENPH